MISGNKSFKVRVKGGPGSGFRGHSGRPGHRGGSMAKAGSPFTSRQLKKITISQAASAPDSMGYMLGRGHTDLPSGITSYQVTTPIDGIVTMTTDEIKE